jgi:ferritin-like metal-binding protein YciE
LVYPCVAPAQHSASFAGPEGRALGGGHYEISRYGTLKAWAAQLGLREAVSLLDATLEEEKNTDQALTKLAEAAVNQDAQQAAE